MTRKKDPQDRRKVQFMVMLSRFEYKALWFAARRIGIPMSTYMRSAAIEKIRAELSRDKEQTD